MSVAPLASRTGRPPRRNVCTSKRLLVPHPDALLSSEFDTTSSYLGGNRQDETLFAWPRKMSTSHASVSNILHSFTWRLPAADAPPHPVHAAVVLLQDVLDNHVIRLEELGLNIQGGGHGKGWAPPPASPGA